MYRKPFITKLHLQNFRSIRDEVIEFDNPLFLVGKNGSGKSNVVDALLFLSDCMRRPISMSADRDRIRLYSENFPIPLIRLRADFCLDTDDNHLSGHYAFSFYNPPSGGISVEHEQCVVMDDTGRSTWVDRVKDRFTTNLGGVQPTLNETALVLPIIGGTPQFAPLVKAFTAMSFYDFEPALLRIPTDMRDSSYLYPNGSNAIAVLSRMDRARPGTLERVAQLLNPIVPGVLNIHPLVIGDPNQAVASFTMQVGEKSTMGIPARYVSDGTLRAFAIIAAAMQDPSPSIIVVEEPETGLHPASTKELRVLWNSPRKGCRWSSRPIAQTSWMQNGSNRSISESLHGNLVRHTYRGLGMHRSNA